MIKCTQCGDNCDEQKMILINQDGDFVCGTQCHQLYEAEKHRFFNDIVHDAQKTKDWLMGKR